jgi:cytochrome oxidase Cu insertion factor (SCO1/SenC/PrrC family)
MLNAQGGGENFPHNSDYDYDPPKAGSYLLPVVKPAADGALRDAQGALLRLREITGDRITVLSFIYTRCRDAKACPYATSVLNLLHRASLKDKSLAKRMRLVSMSFDPEHDTPERLAAYAGLVRDEKDGCEWRFVTAQSPSDLRPILASYGQAVDQQANAADPQGPLSHTLRVYLIDRERRIRNIYSSGTLDPRLVLADVKTLLMEEGQEEGER